MLSASRRGTDRTRTAARPSSASWPTPRRGWASGTTRDERLGATARAERDPAGVVRGAGRGVAALREDDSALGVRGHQGGDLGAQDTAPPGSPLRRADARQRRGGAPAAPSAGALHL